MNPDRREFIPPVHFQAVCSFAIREVMSTGIGDLGEFDYTISDCLTVALLYPKNPPPFRLPPASSLAHLYNAFATLQERLEQER